MTNIFTIMPSLIFSLYFCASLLGEEQGIIDFNAISGGNIIGKLGFEVGQVVEVDGEIIKGEKTSDLAFYGQYLIKVNSVNGIKTQDILLFQFTKSPVAEIEVPKDIEELIKMSGQEFDRGFTTSEIETLEGKYLNKAYKFYCVENIELYGIKIKDDMENRFKIIEGWQGMSFKCRSTLLLLKKL